MGSFAPGVEEAKVECWAFGRPKALAGMEAERFELSIYRVQGGRLNQLSYAPVVASGLGRPLFPLPS